MERCERVDIGTERATVRWEGDVGDTGAWLGVEWDREGRGKHDGEHKVRPDILSPLIFLISVHGIKIYITITLERISILSAGYFILQARQTGKLLQLCEETQGDILGDRTP